VRLDHSARTYHFVVAMWESKQGDKRPKIITHKDGFVRFLRAYIARAWNSRRTVIIDLRFSNDLALPVGFASTRLWAGNRRLSLKNCGGASVETRRTVSYLNPVRSRTPRPSRLRRNSNHTSHAHGAVRRAKIIINPTAVKRDAVLCANVGENSLAAVYVIRRTKPSISHAINPASDTVAVAGPVPAHGVALRDIQCVRHKGEALPYRDIPHPRRESFARRPAGAWSRRRSGRSSPRRNEQSGSSCCEQDQARNSPQS
jgi:hypothetical protein